MKDINVIEKRGENMGRNFVGVKEVVSHYDIFPLKEELTKLPEIPFSEKRLKRNRNNHILFPVSEPDDDSEPKLKWFLMSTTLIKKSLEMGWRPFIELGRYRLPLRPFLEPLVFSKR